MTPDESEALLRRSLEGVALTLAAVWPVFKECAGHPVEVVEDALLFEGGFYEFYVRLPEDYGLHLCRQFIHAEEAEDEDFEQLSLELIDRDVALPVVKAFWSYDFDNSLEAFFKHAEELPEFSAIHAKTAHTLEIRRQRI